MKKSTRHEMLLSLIEEFDITKQEQFIAILHRRGVYVAQATISRDISELGLVKVSAQNGGRKYARNGTGSIFPKKEQGSYANMWKTLNQNEQMLLLETYPGNAFLLKQQFKKKYPQTPILSDDDTIVLYFSSASEAKIQKKKIEEGF